MAQAEKALQRLLRGTSDANITFKELRKTLISLGFEQRAPKGSHYTFAHPQVEEILTIPKRKPLKTVYVEKARGLILKYQLADDGST